MHIGLFSSYIVSSCLWYFQCVWSFWHNQECGAGTGQCSQQAQRVGLHWLWNPQECYWCHCLYESFWPWWPVSQSRKSKYYYIAYFPPCCPAVTPQCFLSLFYGFHWLPTSSKCHCFYLCCSKTISKSFPLYSISLMPMILCIQEEKNQNHVHVISFGGSEGIFMKLC